MSITLYSTDCPRCKVLEAKLKSKNIPFSISNDIDTMISLGYQSAPLLGVDGKVLEFGDAVKWVNAQ